MKAIFLSSFFIFDIGSVISAAAPSSAVFIAGRAISGLGAAGVFSGGSMCVTCVPSSMTELMESRIVANTTPLKHRPIYQGICGGMECMALALGPLVSGAIAHASS